MNRNERYLQCVSMFYTEDKSAESVDLCRSSVTKSLVYPQNGNEEAGEGNRQK